MAIIRKIQASEGISGGSMPNMEVRNPANQALQNLGATITDAADRFLQQEQKKEDFKTENAYRTLQLDLNQQMETRAERMPEDGTGFAKGFNTEVYTPAREAFLAGVPERLRDKYQTILGDDGADTKAWSIKAATRERDQLYKWYDNQLNIGQEELQTAISLDPNGYETILKQGLDQIDASGLPNDQKATKKQEWTRVAQIAHLNKTLETNPEAVLKDLGADGRMLTPTTQRALLTSALEFAETGGEKDPNNAVSPKGALGVRQVMPGTARDISRWMKDGLIDKNMSDARIAEIMSNPATNRRYSDFYLDKLTKEYGKKGGLEAVLIGYNAGPAVAQKWIDSNFDNSVLPSETRGYVAKIMNRLPATYGTQNMTKPTPGDPSTVQFEFNRKGLAALSKQDEASMNPDAVNRVKTAFASLGINKVRITSGFRTEADNKRVGGADKSQHKHGNAMDIDVSGYSRAERVNIIQALSAAGITGLGIGANIIHADTGGLRAWGYAASNGGGAVPKWAEQAVADHLAGNAKPPVSRVGVGGRYSGLPYDQRQKYIHAADQELSRQQAAASKGTAVQRYEMRNSMANELASIQTSGQSTGAVDDTQIATVLGEDDYIKFVEQRDTATRIYGARQGIGEMDVSEMESRLNDYAPIPGSPTFAADQQVQAAVQKEIDRITKLRASKPVEAALQFPEVKAAWDAIDTGDSQPPQPEAVQEFVRLNLERQKEFGIKPGSEEPVPRAWSMQIGQSLAKIPEISKGNMADVRANIIVQYDSLQKVFGDYTDEVIISALKEYKGVGPNTAEQIKNFMSSIQAGGDPFKRFREGDRALDMDQVEESSGFWGGLRDFFRGERDEDPAVTDLDATAETGVNPDMRLRAITAIENLGDDMTPEQEESLIRRFGKATVDAAKASRN